MFILSDTTDPDIFIAEEAAFLALRERLGADAHIYYRHRPKNDAKKAGNIAEWLQRFGGHYEHMIVLDADSLMTGDTLVRLVAAMERNPGVGLIQTFPVMVNATTPFARVQQFAGRLYGPLIALRACLVARRRRQLLGPQRDHPHARFRRVRRTASAERAAPDRRAYPEPRLRRGGADAARRLGGPHGARARRLLRGVAALAHRICGARPALVPGQPAAHGRAAGARTALGDAAASCDRHRRLRGGAAVAVVSVRRHHDFVAGAVHPAGIFPENLHALSAMARAGSGARRLGVRRHDGAAARAQAIGYLAMLPDRATRKGFGGGIARVLQHAGRDVISGLIAPVMMLIQSASVMAILSGRDSGWQAQRRDDGSLPLRDVMRRYGWQRLSASCSRSPPTACRFRCSPG